MSADPKASGAPADAAQADFSQRVTYTYLIGVYLAVNALRDAYVLIEGPDCAHMKTQYLQGNHDWCSTLTSVSGYHRVANTALHPAHMTRSREAHVREALVRLAEHPATGGVLLTSMPMAFITGADYERLCAEVGEATGKTPIHVPGKSLSGDWLDGYAETLLAFARQLDLGGGDPRPERVAIIGHLFDRNEEDQRANVRELTRLLEALGLDVVSVWLSGQAFADLSAVRDAGTLIALPYGRRAARALARRTGATVIDTDLPFGLPATESWLRQIAAATGREAAAEALIESELADIVPRLEWVVPMRLQGRRAGYVGDPWLLRGFLSTVALVGMQTCFVVVPNHARAEHRLAEVVPPGVPVQTWPRMTAFRDFVLGHALADPGLDLLVSNNAGISILDCATLEFGFPAFYQHHLFERPFLGFSGAIAFLDSMANALVQYELFDRLKAMRAAADASGGALPGPPRH